jgi:hypothetical protein
MPQTSSSGLTPCRVACRITGKDQWSDPANLILMTRKRLLRLVGGLEGRNVTVGYTGLRLGPLSSNLFLSIA